MAQGILFEPERVARAELQRSIVRLDLAEARRRLEEFRRLWPEAKLSWEPELIRIGEPLLSRRLDLDSGFREWNRLHRRLVELEVPGPAVDSLHRNLFSRLLAANRRLFEEFRTPSGRSIGDFHLLAGQPKNARRAFDNEIKKLGDGWRQRLGLGNCDFRLGNLAAARANYRWSYLLGLPEDRWPSIEDLDLLDRLQDAEEREWAFPEICIHRILPPPRFSSRSEFEAFKSEYARAFVEVAGPQRFCLHWIVSENKPFCAENELLEARRQMKALHPHLHQRYMQGLR